MASRAGSGAQWRDGAQRRRAPRAWLPDDPTLGAHGGPRRRSGARRRALSALATAYWRPVYGYLRLHWRKPHDEAADLTQDFFAHALEKDLLARFDPARARL